jgi:hypothetical protein
LMFDTSRINRMDLNAAGRSGHSANEFR